MLFFFPYLSMKKKKKIMLKCECIYIYLKLLIAGGQTKNNEQKENLYFLLFLKSAHHGILMPMDTSPIFLCWFFSVPPTSKFCNVLRLNAFSSLLLSPLPFLVFLGFKRISGNNSQIYVFIPDPFLNANCIWMSHWHFN